MTQYITIHGKVEIYRDTGVSKNLQNARHTHIIKIRKGRESDREKERDIGGDREKKRERERGEREGHIQFFLNFPNGEIKRKQRLITRNYCIMTQIYHENLSGEIITQYIMNKNV